LDLVTVGSRIQGALAVAEGASSPLTSIDRTAQLPSPHPLPDARTRRRMSFLTLVS
jgi:hypothetical protein